MNYYFLRKDDVVTAIYHYEEFLDCVAFSALLMWVTLNKLGNLLKQQEIEVKVTPGWE